jgi:hypothetical protein
MIVGDLVGVDAASTTGEVISVLLSEGGIEVVVDIELWWNAESAFDAFPYEFGMKEDTFAC